MEAQAENDKRGPSPASSRYCKSKPEREPPHRAIIPDITNKTSFNQRSQLKPCMRGEQEERDRREHAPGGHPRVRGEQSTIECPRATLTGSSPHARGTVMLAQPGLPSAGIIPAYAGNRAIWPRTRSPGEDHPRMRGEQLVCAHTPSECMGSSPHARGTGHHDHVQRLRPGIIPACAGNSACRGA